MKILIIEDDLALGPLFQMVLEEADHSADLATTGVAALKLMAAGAYELLVVDYQLPGGVSGHEIAQIARSTDPKLWILFISGDPKNDPSAEFAPQSSFLAKPFEMEVMTALVAAAKRSIRA